MATMSLTAKKRVQIFQKVPELGLFIVFVGTLILFSTFNEYFASVASLKILLVTVVYTGIVLIGQALLMIVGELDLSVGAIASLGSITTGMMLAGWNLPLPVAALLGVGIGTFVGFLNGFITVKIGIPAFITTLAMLFLARGISYVLSGGDPVYPLPQNAGDLSRPMILGFPSVVWIFLILFMCSDQFVRRSVLGRKFYLIGGNQVAARLSGIKVDKIKIGLFMLCGGLSAFAGILLMSKLQRSDPVTGLGWELSVIAAAAVGGIKLTGGGGSLTGAFIGILFLQVILQGLVMIGLNPFLLEAVVGAVMIMAVWIATLKSKK